MTDTSQGMKPGRTHRAAHRRARKQEVRPALGVTCQRARKHRRWEQHNGIPRRHWEMKWLHAEAMDEDFRRTHGYWR